MTNSASFIERPTEFKAMQWDTMESAINMMEWLQEQGMMEVQIVQRPIYTSNKPYIEYREPNRTQKVFLEQYVVVNTDLGETKVLWPRDFERLFMERPMTVAEANERFLRNSLNLVGEQRIVGLEIHRFSEDVQPVETCCRDLNEPEPEEDTVNLESDEMAESRSFQRDVASLINRWGVDTVSGTPDFILAEFFETVLGAWNEAAIKRAKWHGDSANSTVPLGEEVGVFHNPNTREKVRQVIDTLTERQIYTNVRKVKSNVTTDMVLEAFDKAGIVFRETV